MLRTSFTTMLSVVVLGLRESPGEAKSTMFLPAGCPQGIRRRLLRGGAFEVFGMQGRHVAPVVTKIGNDHAKFHTCWCRCGGGPKTLNFMKFGNTITQTPHRR